MSESRDRSSRNLQVKSGALLASSLLLSASFQLSAQELSVAGNSVTVSNPGSGFSDVLTIGSDGVVSDLTGVPTSGGLDIPNFSFALEQDNVADGTYTFSGGFIIDDENSGRRLEISIPEVSMSFSSGVLSGSVSAAQSVTVLGRSADSVTQVSTSVSNNFAAFSGSSLSFDAQNQLALISAQGGIFADIVTTIDAIASGNYSYAVFLKQTGGPANVRFGTGSTTSFTQFPCTDGSAFILNGGSLASVYNGAEGLQGQLKFDGSSGSLAVGDPALFSASTCATFTPPSSGGGGGGGTPPPPPPPDVESDNSDLQDALDAIDIPIGGEVDENLIESIDSALTDTTELANRLVSDIGSGAVDSSTAIDIVGTLNDALNLAGSAIQADAAINLDSVVDILGGVGGAIDALDNDAPLTSVLIDTIETSTLSTLSAATDLVSDDSDVETAKQIVSASADVINSVVGVGGSLDQTLIDSARSLVDSTLEKNLDEIASTLSIDASFTDAAATQALLSENSTLLSAVLEVTSISLLSTDQVDQADAQSAIQGQGVSSAGADNLAEDLAQFSVPTGFAIEKDGQTVSAVDLVTASLVGATDVAVDSITGGLKVTTDVGDVNVLVSDVAIVPSSIPNGTFVQPDGSVVSIDNGVSITLVPSPSDPIEFVSAIEDVGAGNFTTDILPNGTIELTDIISGDIFAATFSFDGAGSGNSGTSTSFTVPEGDPADPDYEFTVTFTDGTIQSVLPIVADPSFFDSVTGFGFDMETDRSNGIIQIAEFRFRPDYFVRPATLIDRLVWISSQDSNGVAYRATDANGDGITDYEVITQDHVQIVYGLQ